MKAIQITKFVHLQTIQYLPIYILGFACNLGYTNKILYSISGFMCSG